MLNCVAQDKWKSAGTGETGTGCEWSVQARVKNGPDFARNRAPSQTAGVQDALRVDPLAGGVNYPHAKIIRAASIREKPGP
jgi:hypothetical protein